MKKVVITLFFTVCVVYGFVSSSNAEAINNSSFFTSIPGAITIDFERFPNGEIVPDGFALTDQYKSLGVVFSSEDNPNVLQTTDPEDAEGRFEAPFKILRAQGGGGSPTSGVRYASGNVYLGSKGTSDMRIDFVTPVTAFGFYLIDNDFTGVRISAFDASGTLLETLIAPQVSEGGRTYRGIKAPMGSTISYLIIDGEDGVDLDSSFIDDLSFTPVPLPGTLLLLGTGLVGLAGIRRNFKNS